MRRVILTLTLALVSSLCLAGALVHPGWAFFGYFLISFGRPGELDWSLLGRPLSLPLVAASLVGSVLHIWRHGYPKVSSIQMRILGLMLLHFYVSGKVLESPYLFLIGHSRPVKSFELWGKFDFYWKLFLVLWLASRTLLDLKWIHRMLLAFAACAGLLAVWANYHYFVLHTYPITGPGPPIGISSGVFADRNDFCILLSMGMVACWYMALLSKRWYFKGGWLAFLPFLLHAILLTESRGGLMGAGVGMFVCTWRSKYRWSLTLGGVFGLVLALLFFTNAALLERYGTIKNFEGDASAMGRLNSWNVGWRIMWGNPFFGAGLENYVELFYDYSDWKPRFATGNDGGQHLVQDVEYEIHRARQAHNMWVQRGGECGVVGIVLLAWLVLSVPFDVFRVRRWLAELRGRKALDDETYERARALANCLDGLMLPYLLTGFFLSMEDFEGLYLMALLTHCLTNWVRHVRDGAAAGQAPTGGPSASAGPDTSLPPPRRELPRAPRTLGGT